MDDIWRKARINALCRGDKPKENNKLLCSKCGCPYDQRDRYCRNCGRRLPKQVINF